MRRKEEGLLANSNTTTDFQPGRVSSDSVLETSEGTSGEAAEEDEVDARVIETVTDVDEVATGPTGSGCRLGWATIAF
jgi:hypothetical protein